MDADFSAKAEPTVAYTVERNTPVMGPVEHSVPTPIRTADNPMPSRDASAAPTLSPEEHHEDKFGWVWIAVGIVILIIVLIVIWALLFSGYY